ncbi:MAG TPA: hypothetical protein VJZ71_20100 [Phycisphaerae bacterium]|nr:hypothetical protein [Phycisphaerae bacterium]
MRDAETNGVNTRRKKAGIETQSNGGKEPDQKTAKNQVGVALSGGGIRSATFSLGLFQALARKNLLRKIDWLSTVSGGGYFGSFLGGLFVRHEGAEEKRVEQVEESLKDSFSWPVRWLRENGRYLSPNGAGDSWLAAAVYLRNWVAIHVVGLLVLCFVLTSTTLVRVWFGYLWNTVPPYERWLSPTSSDGFWWSPWIFLPVFTFAVWMVPAGGLYWLTQFNVFLPAIATLFGISRNESQIPSTAEIPTTEILARTRNRLAKSLSIGLIVTLVLFTFALVDSIGQTLYRKWAFENFEFPSKWTGTSVTIAVIFGLAQKIANLFDKLPRRQSLRVPVDLVALLIAVAWVSIIVLSLSVFVHRLAWNREIPWENATGPVNVVKGVAPLVWSVLISFGFSWWFSRKFGFVNLSSHQQLYSARLKRAYLGASNVTRREDAQYSITDPIAGDELPLNKYQPHQVGGPLHLLNVTLNETFSGKSQIEQRDRKGLSMAVGPCGMSVGINDHALWTSAEKDELVPLLSEPEDKEEKHGDKAKVVRFHALTAGTDGKPRTVEKLELGNWVAISGAAVSTGLGASTSVGLSLLLGLLNIRLGYWWDSHVVPGQRKGRTKPGFAALMGEVFSTVLPVQSCLLDEFMGRFHGPARRHWYLSDGGHFENTAAYELIRRRVPFIIVSDAGRDTGYEFADIANLVRKARIDFGAEIEFLRHRNFEGPASFKSADDLKYLEDVVHPDLLNIIGAPEDFFPIEGLVKGRVNDADAGVTYFPKHALLARVTYSDPEQLGWILIIKPGLSGDEPADLLQYQKTQPNFPQESTMDQYFDEAQWESYRKLGEHIGLLLFAAPQGGKPPTEDLWSPSRMQPPLTRIVVAGPST